MQNYKSFETHDGHLEVFETAEPVTWKPGEPLLWYHVFNIEVLEQELALIKQSSKGRFTIETSGRRENVYCCAKDIFKLCGTYNQRQRAAHLIRECDRLEAKWCHQSNIKDGFVAPGKTFDEEEWSRDFENLERDIAECLRRPAM